MESVLLPQGPFDLYLPVPEKVAEVFRSLQQENAGTPSPYWARLWPSAIALASFLQRHPHYVQGKSVAELAAGIGLPSMVAAKVAHTVWCSDWVPEAMEVAAKTAELHGLQNITLAACNWNQLPGELLPDVMLLSDVNYEPGVFEELWQVIQSFLAKGTTILLATPQRLMAKPFIEKLLPFVTDQTLEDVNTGPLPATIHIFVLQKR